MRVLVFGSRTWSDRDRIYRDLDALASEHGRLTVIAGAARGADRYAAGWAVQSGGHDTELFAADWATCGAECPPGHQRLNGRGGYYCPTAGLRRNQQMIDEGKPDRALGYVTPSLSESRGSADMHRRLMAAGIETVLYEAGAQR